MTKPRVSVIMIFLNAEQFLAEAVESVIAQTCTDWELLLVNDGSSDDSGAIARTFEAQDPGRIRYLEHPGAANLGTGPSRELGLQSAVGEFVAFLDADDVWLPQNLEKRVALLDEHPGAAMVYGPTLLWYDWDARNRAGDCRDQMRVLGVEANRMYGQRELIPCYLREEALPPQPCGLMVRRSAAMRVGGFEKTFAGMYEDQAFIYRVCMTESVFVTDECLDRYRQHAGSISVAAEKAGFYDGEGPSTAHEAFLRWVEREVAARDCMTPPIRAALDYALEPYTRPLRGWLRARVRGVRAKLRRYLAHLPFLRR